MSVRTTPGRNKHTFVDSGITIELLKIGPTTIQRIAEQVRKEAKLLPVGHEHRYPDPPVQVVEIAGETREETNPNDPDYRARLDQWGTWAMGQVEERVLRYAAAESVIPIEQTPAEIHAAAERVRRRMRAEGIDLPTWDGYDEEENDRIVWLAHVCIRSVGDYSDFYRALTQRSEVTEEAIASETATFRPAAVP